MYCKYHVQFFFFYVCWYCGMCVVCVRFFFCFLDCRPNFISLVRKNKMSAKNKFFYVIISVVIGGKYKYFLVRRTCKVHTASNRQQVSWRF